MSTETWELSGTVHERTGWRRIVSAEATPPTWELLEEETYNSMVCRLCFRYVARHVDRTFSALRSRSLASCLISFISRGDGSFGTSVEQLGQTLTRSVCVRASISACVTKRRLLRLDWM